MKCFRAIFAALLLLVVGRASAFTPETGLWWYPAEDGRGYTIEIQDNIMVVLVYGYDTNSTSAFFIAANAMSGPGGNSQFTGPLDGFTGGNATHARTQDAPSPSMEWVAASLSLSPVKTLPS